MVENDEREPVPRILRGGPEFEQRLLRSAKLDRLTSSALKQSVEDTLLRARAQKNARRGQFAALATAVVLAAAVAVVVSSRRRQSLATQVAPEPELARSTVVAPSASAAPALLPCPNPVVAQGDSPLIDDFEDRNARLLVRDGRSGTWLSNGDGTGKQTPRAGQNAFPVFVPGGRASGKYALHSFGEQLTGSGSGLSVSLAPGHCYDASRYAGVEFWARGPGRIHLGFTMIDVMAREWGGLCTHDCYDRHRTPIDLQGRWAHYSVRWDELKQVGWGARLAFDPRRLLSLDFMVDSADTPFDYWIDDVSFIEP